MATMIKGLITNIQRFQLHDGPGIRTIVFIKGCPLSCPWCSNPETQNGQPEIMLARALCVRCGRCVAVCPASASKLVEGEIVIDRSVCRGNGVCVEECPVGARKFAGQYVTVEEAMEEIAKDTLFYRNSGGGVTLSGGEPTTQPEFSAELLRQCHREGFHTALETCGYTSEKNLAMVIEHADLVLYDIKHMNSVLHKEVIGVPNDSILSNAGMVAAQGKRMVLRIPVVPGFNDSEENIRETAGFARELDSSVEGIDLLPLHSLGLGKYEQLGRTCESGDLLPEGSQLEKLQAVIESEGVKARVY